MTRTEHSSYVYCVGQFFSNGRCFSYQIINGFGAWERARMDFLFWFLHFIFSMDLILLHCLLYLTGSKWIAVKRFCPRGHPRVADHLPASPNFAFCRPFLFEVGTFCGAKCIMIILPALFLFRPQLTPECLRPVTLQPTRDQDSVPLSKRGFFLSRDSHELQFFFFSSGPLSGLFVDLTVSPK